MSAHVSWKQPSLVEEKLWAVKCPPTTLQKLYEVFTCRVRIENFWRVFWEWGPSMRRQMSTLNPSCGRGPYPVHRSVRILDNWDSFEKETRTLRCHPCQGRNFFECKATSTYTKKILAVLSKVSSCKETQTQMCEKPKWGTRFWQSLRIPLLCG